MVERTFEIEYDAGEVQKAEAHSSGRSVRVGLAFLRDEEEVEKLLIYIRYKKQSLCNIQLTLKGEDRKRSVYPDSLTLCNRIFSLVTQRIELAQCHNPSFIVPNRFFPFGMN